MKKFLKLSILIISIMSIFSCGSKKIENYQTNEPKLDIFEYFQGKTTAYGLMQDRSGKVTRYFTVEMEGQFKDNILTLNEKFVFDDGEKQTRVWKIEKIDEHNFKGGAGDVIGQAKGKQFGNAMQMNYVLRVPYKGKELDLKIDDWMYLIDENRLINKSKITKFGFQVASLTIGFNKK